MSAKYFRDASNNYLGATSGEAMAGGIEVASAPSDARMVLANGAWEMPAGVSPDIGVTVLSPTGDGSTLTGVVGSDSIDFLPTTTNKKNA